MYILAQIDTAIRILPPAGVFTNACPLGTARIAAHRCRLSYENCGARAVMHRKAPTRKLLTGHGSQFNEEKVHGIGQRTLRFPKSLPAENG